MSKPSHVKPRCHFRWHILTSQCRGLWILTKNSLKKPDVLRWTNLSKLPHVKPLCHSRWHILTLQCCVTFCISQLHKIAKGWYLNIQNKWAAPSEKGAYGVSNIMRANDVLDVIQWWFVNPDTLVPGWYFRINKFSGLLNHPSVQKRKSVPSLFVRIIEISGLLEPRLTNHHCIWRHNWKYPTCDSDVPVKYCDILFSKVFSEKSINTFIVIESWNVPHKKIYNYHKPPFCLMQLKYFKTFSQHASCTFC